MINSRAALLPRLGTGRPQYSQSLNLRTFSSATFSRYSASRGQRLQLMISFWARNNLAILNNYRCAAPEIQSLAATGDDGYRRLSELRQNLVSRRTDRNHRGRL